MEYILVAITVIFGAGLTFFSGFGLGTLMLPVFSLFFDPAIAIGATAIVHLANNVFKFALVHKHIHFPTLLRFGVPALIFAILGSLLISSISQSEILYSYTLFNKTVEMTTINVIIGSLMIFFAWFDLDPRFDDLKVDAKHIPIGGSLSGFFGGVSGHQGAFRAAFLSKAGLSKEAFIGTSNSVSLIVDLTRIPIYLFAPALISGNKGTSLMTALNDGTMLLIVGIVCAFIGTYFGKKLVQKTTITIIQRVVGVLLFIMGGLMISGIL